MGKIKIYELAKQMNVESKKLVEIAIKNGIDVKSHLSNVEDEDVEKLKKILSNGSASKNESAKTVEKSEAKTAEKSAEKPAVKSVEKEKKAKGNENNASAKKSNKNAETPVIIRREVIINEEKNNEAQSNKKSQSNKNDIGFINHNNRNKDFNIVYRNKPSKPLTMDELFGINKNKPSNKPSNENQKVKSEESTNASKDNVNKESIAKEVSNNEVAKKVENANNVTVENSEKIPQRRNDYNRNQNFEYNQDRRNFDRNNNGYRDRQNGDNFRQNRTNNYNNNRNGNNGFNNNSNGGNNYNRNGNNNFRNGGNFNNNRNGNNTYGNNNYGNNNFGNGNRQQNGNFQGRQQGGMSQRKVESTMKDMFDIDIVEKENVRDFSNRNKDKQKENQKLNMQKQPKKNRKDDENSFDSDKLKNLKGHSKFNDDDMLDYYDLSNDRGRHGKKKSDKQEERNKQKIFKLTEITIPENITVKDLASEMKITSSEVIKKLMDLGIIASINNVIDFDTAYLIAQEFGINVTKKNVVTDEDILIDETEDTEEELKPRPPVIVVMGHVDHGKTSLLDAIRKTNVISGESGGITQHIGAYQVDVNGRQITFLDTPGHEAFTSMRARGAMITDIAILVVAANDGVMPQTVEAINHAKAAGIPIIVAVNKMDLPDSNFEKVQQELMKYELVPEEWGGNTIYVPISAKKGDGIDNLLEMVLLQADVLELKANPTKQAKGTIIEARLDKTKGPIATMLVQRGKLDVGDTIIVGSVIGRIRTMKNALGKNVKSAGPSTPVEITGLHSVPETGETFYEVEDEKVAKHLIEKRKYEERQKAIAHTSTAVTLDDLFSKIENENLKILNLIVKADVQGSAEAIKQSLEKLSNDEVRVNVIHSSVGGVTETDVTLAQVSNAIIIAFNVRPEVTALDIAKKEGVELKTYSVIYDAINDVESAMKGLLDPIYKEVVIGTAEVRQVFKVSNVGTIAGCYVLTGKVSRNAGIRVIRENIVIHDGKLVSLKRFKDDAKEVDKGYECGLQIEGFNDIKELDQLEVYIMEEVKR